MYEHYIYLVKYGRGIYYRKNQCGDYSSVTTTADQENFVVK